MAYLANISIHPVKSLEPVSLHCVRVLRSGGLEGDRTFALFDAAGHFINGKRNTLVHRLRSSYDPITGLLRLGRADQSVSAEFHVDRQRPELQCWLTEFFGMPVTFRSNPDGGFPDDLDSPGPTVISTGTLAEVASWFPPLDTSSLRVRIRANLEIGGVPAFWEDRLYGLKGSRVRFGIGDCVFEGNNPCQRCVVPSRDPAAGEEYPDFIKTFVECRKQTLPDWVPRSWFNHFYRLAVNTLLFSQNAGNMLRVGDEVQILTR